MSGKEFHQKLKDLCGEATSSKDPAQRLALYEITGIVHCTLQDLHIHAFMESQARAAFARKMAEGAGNPNNQ